MSLGSDVSHFVEKPVKPYRGRICNWYKSYCGPRGLGYVIIVDYVDHPDTPGIGWHTTYVVSHSDPSLSPQEVETRNSIYTLIGPEAI